MAEAPQPLPAFTTWDTFPFEGDLKVKALDPRVEVEPPRKGEEIADCKACQSGDDSYIWVNERWRVRSMDRPTGLPMILILEPRSHLDLGDLPNLLAAELGVMTVRVERAIRSLDNVARVHVNRWGDGAAHLHIWFMARPKGQLQLRGSFLPMWDDILPPAAESQWREDLALVAAWLADFGGTAFAQPPRIEWQAPSTFTGESALAAAEIPTETLVADPTAAPLGDAATEESAEDGGTPNSVASSAEGATPTASPSGAAPGPVVNDRDDEPTSSAGSAGAGAVVQAAVLPAGVPGNVGSPRSADSTAGGSQEGSAPVAPQQSTDPAVVRPAPAIGTAPVPAQTVAPAVPAAHVPTQQTPGSAGAPAQPSN